MAYDRPVVFTNTNNYGSELDEDDVYTIKEFKQSCESGAFIDYDGFGYPIKDKLADNKIIIRPSQLEDIPNDATHIVWYNK